MKSDDVEFWEPRYRAGRTPWDAGGVPRAFAEFLGRHGAPGRALVPGCGSGYEARALAEAGWSVVAIDFSPAAVERARQVLGPFAKCVCLADFFSDHFGAGFDLVYERTFLCSLPRERWGEYSHRMASLLQPGALLAGFFYCGHDPEPPPFGLTEQGALKLFGRWFKRVRDTAIPANQSMPVYAGFERWQEWVRMDGASP
jgi:SAM-dependent methyltransferase